MPAYTNLCKNVSSYRKLSLMTDSTIQFLRDLIAINSVNPSLVSGAAGENQIGAAIANKLRAGGLDVQLEPLAAGRSNVIGVIEGKQKGRSLMFCGHMDTVGVAGMETPFDPIEKDGRIYGRGSQDMQGGLAAMVAAALDLSKSGGLPAGRLVLAAVLRGEKAHLRGDAPRPTSETECRVLWR